jgi:outer membrane receptor protein involved in Fe transport
MNSIAIAVALAMGAGCGTHDAKAQTQAVEARRFDIPAGKLSDALKQLGMQSKLQLLAPPELTQGLRAKSVAGNYTAKQALDQLLVGSGLSYEFVNATTVVIKKSVAPVPAPAREAKNPVGRASTDDQNIVGMPAIMVKGERTLNMDIQRSVDDPQPYVVFTREVIESSGAVNINDFLRTRLTMGTNGAANAQTGFVGGDVSSVSLRGMGEGQTLILIDGRRVARSSTGYSSGQADLNGIPLAAIERIEVLPTTASAIYGGSATGGVINVILRRDFVGSQVGVTYDNTFDTDSAIKRIDMSTGFSLFDGKTSVWLSGSLSEANSLRVSDRDFMRDARQTILANNPAGLRIGSYPPISSTANIIAADGSNLRLRDGTDLGSSITHAPAGYLGALSDNGAGLVANAGGFNLDLADSGLQYPAAGGADLLAVPRVTSFSGSVKHEFNDRFNAYIDYSYSANKSATRTAKLIASLVPATSAANPFQQAVWISTYAPQLDGLVRSNSSYRRIGAGLVFKLGEEWTGALDYTRTEAEISSVNDSPYFPASFNADVQSGVIDLLKDPYLLGNDLLPYFAGNAITWFPIESVAKNPSLRISGPLGSLPGGKPTVSMLLERQDLAYGMGMQATPVAATFFPPRTQTVDSAYFELSLPIFSQLNRVKWIESLDLQLAGRWDFYKSWNASHAGGTIGGPPPVFTYVNQEANEFSPLVAIKYRPGESLMFRASYSTGFIPPDVNQLGVPTQYENFASFADPRRGFTGPAAPYLRSQGGSPDLVPEESKSWSAGVVLTPAAISSLRVSLDFTRTEKTNVISTLSDQVILDNEDSFPGRITRGAKLPTDPADWAGPIIALDGSMVNVGKFNIDTIDMQFDYTWQTERFGEFDWFAVGTWIGKYERQLAPTLPFTDQLGIGGSTANIALKYKANTGIRWRKDTWTGGWTLRYLDSYLVANPALASSGNAIASQGNGGRIPSQTYQDVYLGYEFGLSDRDGVVGRIVDGLDVKIGIRNLFNRKPPFDYSMLNYYSYLGDPRLASYYVTVTKSF